MKEFKNNFFAVIVRCLTMQIFWQILLSREGKYQTVLCFLCWDECIKNYLLILISLFVNFNFFINYSHAASFYLFGKSVHKTSPYLLRISSNKHNRLRKHSKRFETFVMLQDTGTSRGNISQLMLHAFLSAFISKRFFNKIYV